jgi:hypothetical protein
MNSTLKKIFLKGGGIEKINDKINIVILLIIIILIVYFYETKISKENEKNIQNPNNVENKITSDENTQNVPIIPDIYNTLRNYDYRTINDPLTPPYKRDDYMIPAYIMDPNNFGIYTQGGPSPFIKMGYLNDKHSKPGEPYKFLTLMGRPKYYGSSRYEYYVMSTNKDDSLKIDLDQYKYRNELYTGDIVTIPQLNHKEYIVHIDRVLDLTYNPYIF